MLRFNKEFAHLLIHPPISRFANGFHPTAKRQFCYGGGILACLGKFFQKPDAASDDRVPPGQYLASRFPVLTYGDTPIVQTEDWEILTDLPTRII